MPDTDELDLYAAALDQMRVRGQIAAEFLEPPVTYPRLESAALQMRMLLELVPLAALVSHRGDVESVASAFRRKDAVDAAKILRRVNPNYWPKPVRQVPTPQGPGRDELVPVTEGFVTETEWQTEWGFLSSVLHARNPFIGEPELAGLVQRLVALHARIVTLLNLHWVDRPGRSALLGMVMAQDGRAHVNTFERLSDGRQMEVEPEVRLDPETTEPPR